VLHLRDDADEVGAVRHVPVGEDHAGLGGVVLVSVEVLQTGRVEAGRRRMMP
jgi:hypothetical protein